ncbi:GWxTD domain-containing protein [Gracilimonas sp.]|uniref:GWxTD domain-containing protein n=1 Tax=Gracilimonas sp. TaxID=1974203 RepID=UPI003BAD8C99
MLAAIRHLKIFLLVLFAGSVLTNCSDYYIDDIERGGGYNYEFGFPELRVSTAGYYNMGGTPIIDVSGDIVYAGLIYAENEQGNLQANVSIDINITDQESGDFVARETLTDSLVSENSSVIFSQNVHRFNKLFEVRPGAFDVEIVLTDEKSGKQTTQNNKVTIPDYADRIAAISEIQIFGKNNALGNADFVPVTTYDVPGQLDSLKFVVQITNSTNNDITVNSRLKKFRADTSVAWPMSIQDYPRSNIRYQGIEYDEFDILQSGTRTLQQQGNIFIEYAYEELDEGNYRLEVEITDGNDIETISGREFGIKPPFYPAVRTAQKMAETLFYIMEEDEYKALMKIKNPDSLKSAIDRFWLRNIGNSALAKEAISMYYNRVEEANKQFSNFKEGWKTDPGMVYILFGPPWSVDDVFNSRMIWYYTNNLDDPERGFLFRVSDLKSKYFPFDNYILDRNILYHNLEYRQIQRWRTGNILTADL